MRKTCLTHTCLWSQTMIKLQRRASTLRLASGGIYQALRHLAGPSGRAVSGVGLRSFARWDCGFESHRAHGCLSIVSVMCCKVEVSATGWSLVQRSPTDCAASLCDLETSWMRRPWSTGAVAPKKKIIIIRQQSALSLPWTINFNTGWIGLRDREKDSLSACHFMKQNTSSEADNFFNAQEIQRVIEIHNFVAVFTTALHWPLSRTWWGQFATS